MTKYDKMDKKQLQEELRRLQKGIPIAAQTVKQAFTERDVAKQAYDAASNDEKPDALLRMLETEAKSRKAHDSITKMQKDFEAAQKAYINLLVAE